MRTCTSCTACCKTLGVHELAKQPGVACAHENAHGCARYASRPPTCRSFYCCWLDERRGWADLERPDLSGLICYEAGGVPYTVTTGLPIFVAIEVLEGAFVRQRPILDRISARYLVVLCLGLTKRRLIGPAAQVELGELMLRAGKPLL